jgi:hypothetical protein
MAESGDAYERIMGLGREESAVIADRDTVRLGSMLQEREEAIAAFLGDGPARQGDDFLDKVLLIQDMNSRLRHEARALHQSLKEELLKLRSETKRLGGYRNGALVTPLNRRVLSRKG